VIDTSITRPLLAFFAMFWTVFNNYEGGKGGVPRTFHGH